MRMLEREGFVHDCYVDIFDGGPTMAAKTDEIRTVRDARAVEIAEIAEDPGGPTELLAAGRLKSFASCYGRVNVREDGRVVIDAAAASMLGVKGGDKVLSVSR
jgi:arginine N-succinyltransferase